MQIRGEWGLRCRPRCGFWWCITLVLDLCLAFCVVLSCVLWCRGCILAAVFSLRLQFGSAQSVGIRKTMEDRITAIADVQVRCTPSLDRRVRPCSVRRCCRRLLCFWPSTVCTPRSLPSLSPSLLSLSISCTLPCPLLCTITLTILPSISLSLTPLPSSACLSCSCRASTCRGLAAPLLVPAEASARTTRTPSPLGTLQCTTATTARTRASSWPKSCTRTCSPVVTSSRILRRRSGGCSLSPTPRCVRL
jgi:hypothetical protein